MEIINIEQWRLKFLNKRRGGGRERKKDTKNRRYIYRQENGGCFRLSHKNFSLNITAV